MKVALIQEHVNDVALVQEQVGDVASVVEHVDGVASVVEHVCTTDDIPDSGLEPRANGLRVQSINNHATRAIRIYTSGLTPTHPPHPLPTGVGWPRGQGTSAEHTRLRITVTRGAQLTTSR